MHKKLFSQPDYFVVVFFVKNYFQNSHFALSK
nr:MAG TPA: hypothetical protein [Caudoviricetes sp.]